jgi:hypothetical protein
MGALITVAGLAAAAAWDGGVAQGTASTQQSAYPSSIVALGHSGVTGYDSNPKNRGTDVPANSWITGTNPRVNSLYRRLLARNPKIKAHNVNLGLAGSKVDDLVRQAQEAAALKPLPQLVVIQTVDNDIKCDGTDKQNYRPFGAMLTRALRIIVKASPRARFLIIRARASDTPVAARVT